LYKKALAIIISLSMILMLVVVFQPAKVEYNPIRPIDAHFIISSWDFPDEYGQGVNGFKFYENSTGSWVAAPYYTHYYPDYHEELGEFYYLHYNDDYTLNWSAGVAMKLEVITVLNSTLVGIVDDPVEGQNYIRHSVSVTNIGEEIFSQQNFTYSAVEWLAGHPMYYYYYDVVLEFLPALGAAYTITVTYEVFW
jgi:hypothetical protein